MTYKLNFLWEDFVGWTNLDYLWLFVANATIIVAALWMGDNLFGIFSAVTGTVCVILVAKGKLSNYVWGTVGVLTYGYLAYTWGYYGEFMLNYMYYLPMQFVGMFLWWRAMDRTITEENETAVVESFTALQAIMTTAILVVSVYLYSTFLVSLEGRLPYLDATTTVLSVFAMILMALRYAEQWLVWIGINIITIYMWFDAMKEGGGQGFAILLMWCVYLINSVYGFWQWKQKEKIQLVNN